MEDDLKDAFYLWEKGAAFGHVLLFSILVLNQRAWFSGKPVPQFKKNKKQKKNPCSFLQEKKEKPQLLALILRIALLKNFLCQKNKKQEKKMLKAGV